MEITIMQFSIFLLTIIKELIGTKSLSEDIAKIVQHILDKRLDEYNEKDSKNINLKPQEIETREQNYSNLLKLKIEIEALLTFYKEKNNQKKLFQSQIPKLLDILDESIGIELENTKNNLNMIVEKQTAITLYHLYDDLKLELRKEF